MSLEKAIETLTQHVVQLGVDISSLRETLQSADLPAPTVSHDDLLSDSEPPAEKPKAKPKKKTAAAVAAVKADAMDAANDALDLLAVQKILTKLSNRDRDVAKLTLEKFIPKDARLNIKSVAESDYPALHAAAREALEALG